MQSGNETNDSPPLSRTNFGTGMSRYAPPIFSHNILDDQKFFSEAIFGPKSHKNLCFIIFIDFTRQDSDSFHINMGMGFKKLHGEDVHASNFTASKSLSTISLALLTLCLQVHKKWREFVYFEGKEKKVQSRQSPRIEPRAPGLSFPCSDHWAATTGQLTTDHQNPLHTLHRWYRMLHSLRKYHQNSVGVDQKILSTRKEPMLSVSLIFSVLERLALAGKWREVVHFKGKEKCPAWLQFSGKSTGSSSTGFDSQ